MESRSMCPFASLAVSTDSWSFGYVSRTCWVLQCFSYFPETLQCSLSCCTVLHSHQQSFHIVTDGCLTSALGGFYFLLLFFCIHIEEIWLTNSTDETFLFYFPLKSSAVLLAFLTIYQKLSLSDFIWSWEGWKDKDDNLVKTLLFLYVWVFCLHVYAPWALCPIAMHGTWGGQKRLSVPLELELQMIVSHWVTGCWKSNLDSPEEHLVLLITEPSLQPKLF